MNHKEKRGIYNVSFNEKKATPILKELEIIENAVIEYIAMYVKGFHINRRDKGRGAEHIKLHLQQGSQGEITIEELVNIGNSIRTYLKNFDEPFVDNNGAKIYEWENDSKVRFRVVTDNMDRQGHTSITFHPSNEQIISFYSDRNLNQKMQFKNPEVEAYYSTYKPNTRDELKALVDDTSINLGDIDTSKITDMSSLFFHTSRTDFSGIEKWDVSRVENMYAMFYGVTSFNADISGWDVSKVEDMEDMFSGAESFNADISGWNVSSVKDMACMFAYATSFNQPIGDWDVSNVKDMDSMFYEAKSFNQDISKWDVSNVEKMRCMFVEAKAFNQDISGWNVGNVKDMRYMFYEAKSFNQDLSDWDLSSIEYIDDETKDLIGNGCSNVRRI